MSRELLSKERQKLISDRLRHEGRVVAETLAQTFGVSADTIRRDLREMAAAGLCERVYGGALAARAEHRPMAQRLVQGQQRKAALAHTVVGLIEPGTTVLFDTGSTNLAIAEALPKSLRLTALTNAPAIASALMAHPNVETILIGGRLDPEIGGAVDGRAVAECGAFTADLFLLGAYGLDRQSGVSATQYDDATFKRTAASRSRRIVVAATTDKIGTAGSFPIVFLGECAAIVLEHDAPDTAVEAIEASGATVIRANRSA